MTAPSTGTGQEGWGVLRPGDRKWHYYRDNTSLCGKVGFYFGDLEPDDGNEVSKDCRACRKKLDKEQGS